ncbi:MAG: MFS transporter [Propionibacteriaceae bacterium]|nr:MFS transporter [Propionibacteriaceae bacterium]
MALRTGSFRLLANRHYLTLFAARTLAMLAVAFTPVALAFGILNLPGGSATDLSTVLACQLGPAVLAVLFGGVVADRYSRARLIALGEAAMGVGWLAMGGLLLTGSVQLAPLCAFAALVGVASAVTYPALTGIIPDLVAEDELTEANAMLQGAAATARLLGVVLGGAVVAFVGGGVALAAAGGGYLLSAVLVLLLPKASRTAGASASMLRQLREGWGEFSSRQWLWVIVVAWGVMYMFFEAAIGVVGPVIAKLDLGGAMGWTIVLTGEAGGAIAGILVSMFWRPRRPIMVGCALALTSGLPGILLGLHWPLALIVVAAVLMGFGFEMFSVYWLTTMQLEVPPESLSRVASYDAFGSLLLGPLGLVLAGPATDAFGAHPLMVFCSLACVAVIGLALLSPGVRSVSPYHDDEPDGFALGEAPLAAGEGVWPQLPRSQAAPDPDAAGCGP